MRKATVINPFPTTTYLGPEYFCDRETETTKMISNIENGQSTTLISIRRIGKTGLIKHVLNRLASVWKGIYIDILETENLNQFLNLFATAILNHAPEKTNVSKKVWNFIKSLKPVISFDPFSGLPQASFDVKKQEVEININSLLHFLDSQKEKHVIAIDEFQQIAKYPEKNVDSWLRTRMQEYGNLVFIFSGSQQHLMAELFTSPGKPFFRSTQLLSLQKIQKNEYARFIVSLFARFRKNIAISTAGEILDWCNTHTYYVQNLCNRVFAATKDKVNEGLWKQQAIEILKEQEMIFFSYRNMLTKPQWRLLKAIALEGKATQPTSKEFISDYGLTTSATVLRSLKTLHDYELVYENYDEKGNKYYSVYDVWLQRWSELMSS